jgi:fructokinase
MTARPLPTVTCIGELLWDVLPEGRTLGGAPANVAFHLAQLGVPVRVVTRLGRDEMGTAARATLAAHGLPLADLQWDDRLPTGAAHVTLAASGEATYRFVTPAAWDALVDPGFEPEVVVFGSLAQRDARSAATVRAFAQRARTRVYDVNLRPPFVTTAIVMASLEIATIVKLNDAEAAQLAVALGLPAALPLFAEALARAFHLELVCITRGGAGAALWARDAWFETPGRPVEVTNTVGAGDAFLAALIHGWSAGDSPTAVLEHANELGAYVATQPGAMPRHPAQP